MCPDLRSIYRISKNHITFEQISAFRGNIMPLTDAKECHFLPLNFHTTTGILVSHPARMLARIRYIYRERYGTQRCWSTFTLCCQHYKLCLTWKIQTVNLQGLLEQSRQKSFVLSRMVKMRRKRLYLHQPHSLPPYAASLMLELSLPVGRD